LSKSGVYSNFAAHGLGELFLVRFDMVRKKFTVERIGDTVEVNLDSSFPKVGAVVNDLDTSAALDWRTSH